MMEGIETITSEGGLANMNRGEPGARAFSWPTTESKVLGRIRDARGPLALKSDPVIFQGYKNPGEKLCKLSKEDFLREKKR
jgi:hypothetical protein